MPKAQILLILVLVSGGHALRAEESAKPKGKDSKEAPVELQPRIEEAGGSLDAVTTHGTVRISGKDVDYTARAGTLQIDGEDGKTKADVFFVAYTKDGADPATRPITFCFNGGPGSSSVWLHLGLVGPKRVELNDPETTPPPNRLVPNEFSVLDFTDVVLIDPVSTGFSRPTDPKNKSKFHGYDEDINSIGEFVHNFVTRDDRWGSPKFLMGESYGTLRAAGLAGRLRDRYRMELNGIVLVSSVLDFRTLKFGDDEVPYVGFLPAYTATAWYHGRLPKDLQSKPLRKVLDEAEEFAIGDYARALLYGDSLKDKTRRSIATQYARLTGLSREYVERSNLRVPMWRFGRELLVKQERTIGRFDSRFDGLSMSTVNDGAEYDPSGAALFGPFTGAMNQYLRHDLDIRRDDVYEILTGKVHPWNYKRFENAHVSSTDTLRKAMIANPHLEVFVANGYYDLATPYFATEYTFDHLHLPRSLQKNVTMGYYEAGHMMYVHLPSLKKLHGDLTRFYRRADGIADAAN